MGAYCYILHSEQLGKYYIGSTNMDPRERLEKHNTAFYGYNRFTASVNDWKILLVITAVDSAHAIRIERKIKKMKSSKFIINLIAFPELIQKVVHETK